MFPFFEWCEKSPLGAAIRDSRWLFPAIESFHLLALALIGGTILLVDLRLLGFGLKRQPVSQLARDVQPWLIGGLVVMITTGILLFTSEAVKCYYSDPFRLKMICLPPAILFTFTIRRRVASHQPVVRPLWSKLVGLASLGLWSGVGAAGRWIGFSG